MNHLVSKLIIYRDIEEADILNRLSQLFEQFHEGNYQRDMLRGDILLQINRLMKLATKYGFDENLWQCYLTFLLITAENPFTLVTERVGTVDGSVNLFVKNDLMIFKQLFAYDFSEIESELDLNCFSVIQSYQAVVKKEQIYNKNVSERVLQLRIELNKAKDSDTLYQLITDFYQSYGTGMIGLNKAFRISDNDRTGILTPITATEKVVLDDLVGYQEQKRQLVQNTEAFICGRKANNVLLFGDAGTGKSTSVKAILNQYFNQGLRMIEIYKHESKQISKVINLIKNRNYRFIIFMDDLSFEDFETEYKYLKAVIEGGLEPKPENVLIYATSNRRHLIRETWQDRSDMSQDDDVHRSDTMQEKLSLAARFGITIGYFKPSQSEYINIVTTLARKHPEITLTDKELASQAAKWEMWQGGTSGRTAQQFVNYLLGAYHV